MKKVIFGLSRSKSEFAIFSKAIMATEKRNFSHVYIKFIEPSTGQMLIFQAAKGMVHVCSENNFLKKNTVVKEYEVDFTEEDFKDLLKYVFKHSGTPYSYAQIISITFQKIFKTKGYTQNGEQEQICSELATRVLRMVGLGGYKKSEDDMTPSDFEGWMESLVDWYPEKIRILPLN